MSRTSSTTARTARSAVSPRTCRRAIRPSGLGVGDRRCPLAAVLVPALLPASACGRDEAEQATFTDLFESEATRIVAAETDWMERVRDEALSLRVRRRAFKPWDEADGQYITEQVVSPGSSRAARRPAGAARRGRSRSAVHAKAGRPDGPHPRVRPAVQLRKNQGRQALSDLHPSEAGREQAVDVLVEEVQAEHEREDRHRDSDRIVAEVAADLSTRSRSGSAPAPQRSGPGAAVVEPAVAERILHLTVCHRCGGLGSGRRRFRLR